MIMTMKLPQNRAVIFDLDGVIVDTAKYHFIAWRKIANDLGFEFTEAQNESLKGVSRIQSLDYLVALGNIRLSQAEKNKLLEAKNEHYLSLIGHINRSEMLTGIPELLEQLHENRIPFALGSASKNARQILDALHITALFSAIVDGNEVTKAKPDPEVFVLAAHKIHFAPEHCIVVEDSKAGIEAANRVNMISVGIGNPDVLSDSKYLLPNTKALTFEFIQSIKI